MNIKLLKKANKETQMLIKTEGEKNLQDIHKSEDLMTIKINTFLTFSFAVFIALAGFCFKSISNNNIDSSFILSVSISIVFSLIIIILFKSVFPKENRLLGSEPDSLIKEDMIKGDEYDEYRIIGNRILCTQKAIKVSLSSYKTRLSSYKMANKILVFGLLFSIIITVIFRLCQCSC